MSKNDDLSLISGAVTDVNGQPVATQGLPAIPSVTVGEAVTTPAPEAQGPLTVPGLKLVNLNQAADDPKKLLAVAADVPAVLPHHNAPPSFNPFKSPVIHLEGLKESSGGVIDPEGVVPPGGLGIEPWDGDPDKEILPGEVVYYWLPGGRPGLLEPHVSILLGRTPGGAYTGMRLRPLQNGVFALGAARPSLTPKRGHFTTRKRFNVYDCTEKPE